MDKGLWIRFLKEEDGVNTVEIVVIVAIMIGLALMFRKGIKEFVGKLLMSAFGVDVSNGLSTDITSNAK